VAEGAQAAATPAQAAAGAQALSSAWWMRRRPGTCCSGRRAPLPPWRPGSAVLLCPTIAPDDVEALAARLQHAAWRPSTRPCRAGRRGRATAA
jgi:3-hydroxyisobutyrate dehydrogenase